MSVTLESHFGGKSKKIQPEPKEKSFFEKTKDAYNTVRTNLSTASSTIKDTTCASPLAGMMQDLIKAARVANGEELTSDEVHRIARATLKKLSTGCGDREQDLIDHILDKASSNGDKVSLCHLLDVDDQLRNGGFKATVTSRPSKK